MSASEVRDFVVCLVVMAVVLWFVIGCANVTQQMDPKVFYKRDVVITVNGRDYEGVVVIPKSSQYEMILTPKGDIDMLLLRSCHREFTGEKLSSGWFSKNKFLYTYRPVSGLEDRGVCPVRVDMYEAKPGRHSWAFLDFQHPDYQIPAVVTCNGSITPIVGVGVCQAKQHTIQRIKFDQAVQFAPVKPDNCEMPHKALDGAYEWEASLGECLYQVRNTQGQLARFTSIGYEGVLVREAQ